MLNNRRAGKLPALFIILFMLPIFVSSAPETHDSRRGIYYPLTPEKYLLGTFNPAKNSRFVLIEKAGIPATRKGIYLRRETVQALKRLYIAFHRAHPSIPFRVQSGTRSFYDQKYIWESKWFGRRLVQGRRLNKSIKDPLKRAREILKFSSMPGTSRHHWGTDFDIHPLYNSYYKKGPGMVLYTWMMENAPKYGFCQPYTAGRKNGYCEERWHWSYLPLSKKFLAEWNKIYRKGFTRLARKGLFAGSGVSGSLAVVYVNAINNDCK